MSDGIEIPAIAVRGIAVAIVLAVAALAWRQLPEVRRYLKMERM
jgi:hypothetical protein